MKITAADGRACMRELMRIEAERDDVDAAWCFQDDAGRVLEKFGWLRRCDGGTFSFDEDARAEIPLAFAMCVTLVDEPLEG